MVYGVLRILHIAHAGIYAFGAYSGLVAFRLVGNFWLSFVIAMILSAGAGYLVQHFLYAPLLSRSRIVPLIASIGLFTAMEEVFRIPRRSVCIALSGQNRILRHHPRLDSHHGISNSHLCDHLSAAGNLVVHHEQDQNRAGHARHVTRYGNCRRDGHSC